jgi:branched-chain amino acid transport system substrate-binding protein
MKTIAQLRWLALLAVFALLVAACSSSDDSSDDTSATETTAATTTVAAKDPIRVPAINQEDGVTAWPDEGQAVKAIFDWYNAQGGLDGHPLQLDLCTAGDDPESTQGCAQAIANDDSAAYVHSIMVPNSASLFDVMANAEKPILAHNQFDIPDALQPDVYATDPGLLPMATTLMVYTLEELGLRNIGIVVSDDEVGRGTAEFLSFLVEDYGGTPATITYDSSVADLLPVFSAADLDAIDGIIFVPTSVEDCGPASQALKSLGFDKPVLGGDACTAQTFVDSGNVEGWIFVVGTTLLIDGNPDRDQTIAVFEEFNGPPIGGLVAPASMGAYFVIDVLEAAYEAAGGDITAMTADVVRQAALAHTGPLTLGPTEFGCPGVDPFVGLCNTSATVVQLEGDIFKELTDWYDIDVTPYAALLEG